VLEDGCDGAVCCGDVCAVASVTAASAVAAKRGINLFTEHPTGCERMGANAGCGWRVPMVELGCARGPRADRGVTALVVSAAKPKGESDWRAQVRGSMIVIVTEIAVPA